MDYLFSAELCDEEQRLQEELTEQMKQREEERATRGSPSMSRHAETKMQKGIHHSSMYEKKGVIVPEVQTADSCFGLIGPRQCSAALGGPATSNS